jgi:hypothetical protein
MLTDNSFAQGVGTLEWHSEWVTGRSARAFSSTAPVMGLALRYQVITLWIGKVAIPMVSNSQPRTNERNLGEKTKSVTFPNCHSQCALRLF